jgi:hypothetical protein
VQFKEETSESRAAQVEMSEMSRSKGRRGSMQDGDEEVGLT